MLSNVISSQAALHERFGGVVPEVASRHHLELVNGVVAEALDDAGDRPRRDRLDRGHPAPGADRRAAVGVSTAKALAAATRKPLAGVDHLHGHVAANFLEPDPLEPPFLCLIASGGHTLLAAVRSHDGFETLGETLDDAAGEALDKASRLLGLGYPGGPAIERCAAEGDPGAFDLPVAMTRDPGLDFSFSGLKTALVYAVAELAETPSWSAGAPTWRPRFQAAVVGQLTAKLERALAAGDVAMPSRSAAASPRTRCCASARRRSASGTGSRLKLVAPELCTDNAAMIASAARFPTPAPYPEYLSWDASSE